MKRPQRELHGWLIDYQRRNEVTDAEMAEILGYSRGYYTMVKNGNCPITASIARRIASTIYGAKARVTAFLADERAS